MTTMTVSVRGLYVAFLMVAIIKEISSGPAIKIFALLDDHSKVALCYSFRNSDDFAMNENYIPAQFQDGNWEFLEYTPSSWNVVSNQRNWNVVSNQKKEQIQESISHADRITLFIKSKENEMPAKDLSPIIKTLVQGNDHAPVTLVFSEMLTLSTKGNKYVDNVLQYLKQGKTRFRRGYSKVEIHLLPGEEKISVRAQKNIVIKYMNGVPEFFVYKSNTWEVDMEARQQVLEAEKVVVRIDATMEKDTNGVFKVGGKTPEQLSKLITETFSEKEHLYQRVRIKFSNPGEHTSELEIFQKNLFNLLPKNMDGSEPYVKLFLIVEDLIEHITVIHNTFESKKLYQSPRNIVAIYKNNDWHYLQYIKGGNRLFEEKDTVPDDVKKVITNAEQLSIRIYSHGGIENSRYSIAHKRPQYLANQINTFFIGIHVSKVQIHFYCCNSGSRQGQEYIRDVIKNINPVFLNIKQAFAFNSWLQINNKGGWAVWVSHDYKNRPQKMLDNNVPRTKRLHLGQLWMKREMTSVLWFDENHNMVKTVNRAPVDEQMSSESERAFLASQGQRVSHGVAIMKKKILDKLSMVRCNKRKRATCPIAEEELRLYTLVGAKKIGEEIQFELAKKGDPSNSFKVLFEPEETSFVTSLEERSRYHTARGSIKVAKTLGAYGAVLGFVAARKYFAEGDVPRGSVSLLQGLHSVGAFSNLNTPLSQMSVKAFQMGIEKSATKLGAEESLAALKLKTSQLLKGPKGRFFSSIPLLGIAFDAYIITEDVRDIISTNFSNPVDKEYLPLKGVNLALDIGLSALVLTETAVPPVILPLILGVTVVRLTLSTFYQDVVEELGSLPDGAGGWEKFNAVLLGVEEGFADVLTGNLFYELKHLEKQYSQTSEIMQRLTQPESYFQIRDRMIDFTAGKLSNYGGSVNLELGEEGVINIQIGDHSQINRTYNFPNVKDMILGIGRSQCFHFQEESAYLWWVIPVLTRKVISGSTPDNRSMFGKYIGNSQDNTFYAVQSPKTKADSENSHYLEAKEEEKRFSSDIRDRFILGPRNSRLIGGKSKTKRETCPDSPDNSEIPPDQMLRNYYYIIEGRGGRDKFILGPQKTRVSGGENSDYYILPKDGGDTVIDNFSHDQQIDILKLYIDFPRVVCGREGDDLKVAYPHSHRIIVKDWFSQGNTAYFRHLKIQTRDGVLLDPKEKGFEGVTCLAVALDLTEELMQILNLKDNFPETVQVIGSKFNDNITANDLDNYINGGPGEDVLFGQKGSNTYEVFPGEGCDSIHNEVEDDNPDIVILHAPFDRIKIEHYGQAIKVFDHENETTCVYLTNWGPHNNHISIMSSDHIMFGLSNTLEILPYILDYGHEETGKNIVLGTNIFSRTVTVGDSKGDDHFTGNALGNLFSCSGGSDFLKGSDGHDHYQVKQNCIGVTVDNCASDGQIDLLYLPFAYDQISLEMFEDNGLVIQSLTGPPAVKLLKWFETQACQHLMVKTADNVMAFLPEQMTDKLRLEAIEISHSDKCPPEPFDLSKEPWDSVIRFNGKSHHCSYSIQGNDHDNYLNSGFGNGKDPQTLTGGLGSDTYVVKYGYGPIIIDNYATDNKTDTLLLQLLFTEVGVNVVDENVVLYCNSDRSSVNVVIKKYHHDEYHQHLEIRTADGYTFTINTDVPSYKQVKQIVLSASQANVRLTAVDFPALEALYGSMGFHNWINSSASHIVGGRVRDMLIAGDGDQMIEGMGGDDEIEGGPGNDILYGGEGDDKLRGGPGDDIIFPGTGADEVEGGPGKDAVILGGDAQTGEGVYVDLSLGFGQKGDADGDSYSGVEDVWGTDFNDILIGDLNDNELHGQSGDDTLIDRDGGQDLMAGGLGRDSYILDYHKGIVIIQNYASDLIMDSVYINSTFQEDVCSFTYGQSLYIVLKHSDPILSVFGEENLLVVVENWLKSEEFRHLDFVIADSHISDDTFNNVSHVQDMQDYFSSISVDDITESCFTVTLSLSRPIPENYRLVLVVANEYRQVHSLSDTDIRESLQICHLSSGLLHTVVGNIMKCGIPVAVSSAILHRTKPNPPQNLSVARIECGRIYLQWSPPLWDTDPNWEDYNYTIKATSPGKEDFITAVVKRTHVQIPSLEINSIYKISVSSSIGGSQSIFSEPISFKETGDSAQIIADQIPTTLPIAERDRVCKYAVDVTIDVDTANRFITVSDDGKTVSSGSSDPLPDSPTRFKSLPFALGKPGFTSGRHYWEVEVSKKTEWILGLAKESVDKKSTLTLSPENGCWTLSLDSVYGIEAVYDPVVRLYVKYLPQKIGIYLDYEGKSVSFYDAKRKAHLHTFNDTFTEALYPFFSPGNIYENLNSDLIITPLSDIQ